MSAGRPPDPASLARPWVDTYPPGVPPTYQLPGVALPRLLDDAVRDFPAHPAVVAGGVTLDHATLRDRVADVRAALVDAGVTTGDRVLVTLPNHASLPVALLAVWRCGAVVVAAGPHERRERLAAIAADAQVRAVVGPRRVVRALADDEPDLVGLTVDDDAWLFPRRLHRLRRLPGRVVAPIARRVPRRGSRRGTGDGPLHLEDVIASALAPADDTEPDDTEPDDTVPDDAAPDDAAPDDTAPEDAQRTDDDTGTGTGTDDAPPRAPRPDDLALLVYGAQDPEPVGVELTHANLVAAAFAGRLWVPDIQAGRERVLVADPVTGPAPMVLGLVMGLLAAATVVLLDGPDPATLARAIERERPTVLPVSADRLPGLLDEGDAAKRDLRSLRVILAVGGPVDRQLATDIERRTGGARVREGFGSAETGTLTHAQPVYGRAEWGTMGLPVTDVLAAVVDPDAPGTVLGPGSVGRLVVRGPQTARGYWNRPETTARRFVDGWVLSDDLVTMDPEGVFRHLGPRDEVLERADGFVAPRHVEAVLERHPGVRRAGVVDSDDGQRLLAAVVVRRRHRPDADTLLVHCREHLDPPAVPDEVTLVDELPETDAGALARETLRERLAGAGDGAS